MRLVSKEKLDTPPAAPGGAAPMPAPPALAQHKPETPGLFARLKQALKARWFKK